MKQTNEKKEQINKMMESYYNYVGYCHTENIIKELDDKKEEIDQIKIPSSINDWFNNFSNKYRRRNNLKKLIKNTQNIGMKIGILMIVALTAVTILTCTVEALRVKIFNFFIEKQEKYTNIQIDEDRESIIPSSWDEYYYPKCLPEGFRVESAEMINDRKIIEYIKDDEYVLMIQSSNGTHYQVDTESSNNKEIIINKYKGLLIEKDGKTIIIWHNEECSFNFTSNIISKELMQIVKSLEKR